MLLLWDIFLFDDFSILPFFASVNVLLFSAVSALFIVADFRFSGFSICQFHFFLLLLSLISLFFLFFSLCLSKLTCFCSYTLSMCYDLSDVTDFFVFTGSVVTRILYFLDSGFFLMYLLKSAVYNFSFVIYFYIL